MTALQRGLQIFTEFQTHWHPKRRVAALEFGVFKGHTLAIIAEAAKALPGVEVFGFDSFEGLPHDWEHTVCKKGTFSTNGVVPDIDGATIYPGWFEDTIPQYLADHDLPIGFLHLDADLYSSTRTILWGLNHLIEKGTVIVADEWFYNGPEKRDDQEQKAFLEWVDEFNRDVVKIDYIDPTFDGWHVGAERALFIVLR